MKLTSIIFTSIILVGCQTEQDTPKKSIDLQLSGEELALFGENIISTPLYERNLAISPSGNQLIYTLGDFRQSKRCLVAMNKENGECCDCEFRLICTDRRAYRKTDSVFSKPKKCKKN